MGSKTTIIIKKDDIMSDMKIRLVKFYDKKGKCVNDGDEFAYITFQMGKEDRPIEGDVFVQVTNLEGVPIIVAKYLIEKYGSGGYGKPEYVNSLEDIKKYGVSEGIVEEIRNICKSKGITWV